METLREDQERAQGSSTSLVAGASWLMAAKTLSFAITAALPLLLARRLSQTEVGHYKQLFLLLQSATNLLPFGMNMSLFYFIPRAKGREEKGNIILGVLIFYLLLTGIAGGALVLHPALIQDLFHSEALSHIGRRIGLTLIPYVISSLLEFIMVANNDIRLSALTAVILNFLRTLLILAVAMYWGTISAILWSVSIFATIQTAWLATYLLKRFGRFWAGFRWDYLWRQLSYALPLGMAGLLWSLQVDIDNYFVAYYFDAAMFAIYAFGCFDVPLLGMLSDSVGSVLIPRVSNLQASNSLTEIADVTAKAMRGLAFVYAPSFAFLFVSANQFITLMFTSRYLASVPIFRVNLLMVLVMICAVDPIMRAFQSERFWMLKMNIVLLILLVAALYFGIPRFGMIGAVASVISIQVLSRALVAWRVSRLLHLRWNDAARLNDVGKTMLAAFAAGLCIAGLLKPVEHWGTIASLLICGVIYCIAYGVALILLKVPTAEEMSWCWQWITRAWRVRPSTM